MKFRRSSQIQDCAVCSQATSGLLRWDADAAPEGLRISWQLDAPVAAEDRAEGILRLLGLQGDVLQHVRRNAVLLEFLQPLLDDMV